MRPRYFRGRQSHCVYVENVHLYVFPFTRDRVKTSTGATVKRRRRDGMWRHYTLRLTVRRGESTILHWEAVTHLSRSARGERISRSKKYVRFKVCV